MKKYEHVLQDDSKDCGVACLQMVIKYYKGYIKKANLIEMTKTTKTGTTAYHLKEALESIGFYCKGVSCNLNDINKDNIILPCIASVTIDSKFKHFVVIYEINFKNRYLIIGDPADKIKKITFNDFSLIFNNVLIIFYPIKNIPLQKNISFLQFILNIVKPNKKMLVNIIILSIFITIFSIITSFYTEYMIDALNKRSNLLYIFIVFLLTHVIKNLTDYFRNYSLAFISQKINLALTLNVFKDIIKLPYYYYKNKTTGDIVSRINDLDNVRQMISKVALSIFIDLPLTILSMILLYLVNHILFFIGFSTIILYFLLILVFKPILNSHIKNIKDNNSSSTSYMVESINNFETLKGIHIENNIISKFEKKYVILLKSIFKYQNFYFFQDLIKNLIGDISIVTVTFVGCILTIKGDIKLGTLFTFLSLLSYFLGPIKNIIGLDQTIKDAKISLKRILDLIDYDVKETGIVDKFKNGDIEFKNLKFSFNNINNILENINITINKNSKVMVVGKSGSGKSTLFKLLMKYNSVDNNSIIIGGIDLNKYTKKSIENNIIYIGQQESLFNDTLYNNLCFKNNSSDSILEVCKMCYVDEIIDSNLGFNTLIEENGFNLSGGERQRIILARSLLQRFNILIIDEALNQVDVDLERKILKNLFKKYKDKTIIVISHRLDNLDLFDSLMKFEKGVVNIEKNG